jgi:hypothetical protein
MQPARARMYAIKNYSVYTQGGILMDCKSTNNNACHAKDTLGLNQAVSSIMGDLIDYGDGGGTIYNPPIVIKQDKSE